jgi:hypothetical protein
VGKSFEGDAFRGGEGGWGVAQGEDRGDDDWVGVESSERGDGAADGGAGVGDVVNHRDGAVADDIGEFGGDGVGDREEFARRWGLRRDTLGMDPREVHLLGDHLGEKRAAGKRSAEGLDAVGDEALDELRHQRAKRGGVHEEAVDVEPEVAVVARLEQEVAATRGDEVEQGRLRSYRDGCSIAMSRCMKIIVNCIDPKAVVKLLGSLTTDFGFLNSQELKAITFENR